MSDPEANIEIVNRRELRSDPELFKDDGVSFDIWLPEAVQNSDGYRQAISPSGLVVVLKDLVEVSKSGVSDWQRWQYENDSSDDIFNFRSIPFKIPNSTNENKYKINIKHPFREFTGTFVELETVAPLPYDDRVRATYVGQQVRFYPDTAAAMGLLQLPKTESIEVTPENERSDYWTMFVKAAVAAHAQFVPVKDIAAESVES